jgi:hypothetical protein
MSEDRSELSEMSSVSEARLLVHRVAEPREVGDSVKAAIVRAARRLGFSHSRTRDLWYGGARRIDSEEMDKLRDIAAKRDADQARANVLAMRNGLAATDAEFHRPTIDALDIALRNLGCEVGPLGFRED